MFGQVSLLAEVFAAHGTRERVLARVRADVNVDGLFVFEALAADAAVVQQTLLLGGGRLAGFQCGCVGRWIVGGHLSGQFHHFLLFRVAFLARFDHVDDGHGRSVGRWRQIAFHGRR